MTAESGLRWLLRLIAVTTIPAFMAAVMPQSWMAFMLHKVEPAMPIGILTTYLTRILMVLYAFVGLQCVVFSADIRRYLPMIWIMGVGTVVLASVALIALFVGVPSDHRTYFFWVVCADFADGLAKGILLVVFLSRLGHHA